LGNSGNVGLDAESAGPYSIVQRQHAFCTTVTNTCLPSIVDVSRSLFEASPGMWGCMLNQLGHTRFYSAGMHLAPPRQTQVGDINLTECSVMLLRLLLLLRLPVRPAAQRGFPCFLPKNTSTVALFLWIFSGVSCFYIFLSAGFKNMLRL
jgi:hypothetical protein